MTNNTGSSQQGALRRELGLWSLAAIGANLVIGAGFFVLPATFFGFVGGLAPALILAVGIALLPIALTFAEAARLSAATGGPSLFVVAAFGKTAGFQVGWLIWCSRIAAHASVLSALILAVRSVWADAGPYMPVYVGVLATSAIAFLNIWGVRLSTAWLNWITVIKFVPVVLLLLAALPYLSFDVVRIDKDLSFADFASAALAIVFALGGFEMLTVPAGEAKDPKRQVLPALLGVVLFTTLVMAWMNLTVGSILPQPANTTAPVADVVTAIGGVNGPLIVLVMIAVAALGHNMSSMTVSSRVLFSLAEQGDLPAGLARVSERSGTPTVSILVTAAAIIALTVSGSFVTLVLVSAFTRLVIYGSVAASVIRLRATGALLRPQGNLILLLSPYVSIAVAAALIFGVTLMSAFMSGAIVIAGVLISFLMKVRAGR